MGKRFVGLLVAGLFCTHIVQAEKLFEALNKKSYTRGTWILTYPHFLLFDGFQEEILGDSPSVNEYQIPEYGLCTAYVESAHEEIPVVQPLAKRLCIFGAQPGFMCLDETDLPSVRPEAENMRETFASLYKIHLMPKPDDIVSVADTVVRALGDDEEVGRAVNQLKIIQPELPVGAEDFKHITNTKIFFDHNGNVLPLIVLYVRPHYAQQLIEKLDSLLHDYEGIQVKDFPEQAYDQLRAYAEKMGQRFTEQWHVIPRFNIAAQTRDGSRVSSLIYYAQGNGDYKAMAPSYTFRAVGTPFERLWENASHNPGLVGGVVAHTNGSITVPGYARLFDPASNGALLYPDYFGEPRDFHLYTR